MAAHVEVFRRHVADHWKSTLVWGASIALMSVLVVVMYPSIGTSEDLAKVISEGPPAYRALTGPFADLTSPAGWLNSQLFFMLIPILFLIFAISRFADAIAGEEDRGTMDLLLSAPIARRRLVAGKIMGITGAIVVLSAALYVAIWLPAVAIGVDVSFGGLGAVVSMNALHTIVIGGVALLVGAATGRKGLAIATASALAVIGYLVNGFAGVVDWMDRFRYASTFHYYIGADPLSNGADIVHLMVLAVAAIGILTASVLAFDRRDVRQ